MPPPPGGGGHIDPLGPCYHKFKEFLNRFEAIIGGRRIKKNAMPLPPQSTEGPCPVQTLKLQLLEIKQIVLRSGNYLISGLRLLLFVPCVCSTPATTPALYNKYR